MFKLEKVFQNDDSGYILFSNFIKSLSITAFLYLELTLEEWGKVKVFMMTEREN